MEPATASGDEPGGVDGEVPRGGSAEAGGLAAADAILGAGVPGGGMTVYRRAAIQALHAGRLGDLGAGAGGAGLPSCFRRKSAYAGNADAVK